MLYDLNIPWSPQTGAVDLDRTLRFSASLGYDVVALNHVIGGAIPPQVTNLIPKYNNKLPPSPSSSIPRPNFPTVLRRATVVLSEPSQHHRLPQLAAAYDILAVRPVTEDSFNAACQSLNDVAIISLDMSTRQPFVMRNKTCMVAVDRGVRFEICYSHAFQGPAPPQILGSKGATSNGGGGGDAGPGFADARARSAFIGNVISLIRATRGRGIILSSEARSVLGIRAPADVINLFHVWGLRTDRAMEGLGVLPRGVVVNEGLKRSGFRGVIDIVGVAEREPEPEQVDAVMGDAMDINTDPSASATATTQGDKQNNSQKRKKSDIDGNETGNNNTVGQPMSKRQAKKMRAAQRNH